MTNVCRKPTLGNRHVWTYIIQSGLRTFHAITYLNRCIRPSSDRVWSHFPKAKSKHFATLNLTLQWILIYALCLSKPFGKRWYIYEGRICNIQSGKDGLPRLLTDQPWSLLWYCVVLDTSIQEESSNLKWFYISLIFHFNMHKSDENLKHSYFNWDALLKLSD